MQGSWQTIIFVRSYFHPVNPPPKKLQIQEQNKQTNAPSAINNVAKIFMVYIDKSAWARWKPKKMHGTELKDDSWTTVAPPHQMPNLRGGDSRPWALCDLKNTTWSISALLQWQGGARRNHTSRRPHKFGAKINKPLVPNKYLWMPWWLIRKGASLIKANGIRRMESGRRTTHTKCRPVSEMWTRFGRRWQFTLAHYQAND